MAKTAREIVVDVKMKGDASKKTGELNKDLDQTTENATAAESALGGLASGAVLVAIGLLAAEFAEFAAELETQRIRLLNLAGDTYPRVIGAINKTIDASRGLVAEGDTSEAVNAALKYGASIELIEGSLSSLQKFSAITGESLTSMLQQMQRSIQSGSTRFLQQNAILAKHVGAFRDLGTEMDAATIKKRELFIVSALQREQMSITEQYNRFLETTNAQLTIAETQWANVKERIGGFILVALKPLLQIGNKVLKWLGETEEGLIALRIAAMVLTPVIIVLAAIAIKGLITSFIALAPAVWAAIVPMLPFIAIAFAVGAAIAVIVLIVQDVITWFEGGISVFGDFVDFLSSGIKFLADKFMFFLDLFLAPARFVIDVISKFVGGNDIEARAGGGPVQAGKSFLVGEQGPEIFSPGRSGVISPMGGGGGTSIGSIVENLTIVASSEEVGENVRQAVLSVLNDLSTDVFRAEAGLAL